MTFAIPGAPRHRRRFHRAMGTPNLPVRLAALLLLPACATARMLPVEPQGMTGYLSVELPPAPAGFGYGFSVFAEVSTLDPAPAAHTQLGWGTWVIPYNRSFDRPLCPRGTQARDHWPERGPSYCDVYQTIEGGPGEWTSTRFPSSSPRFRINSTPDCYNTEVASTGWSFYQERLAGDRLGLAQLSDRLPIPPDRLTFRGTTTPGSLGYGWIALPSSRPEPRRSDCRPATRAGRSSWLHPTSPDRWPSSPRRSGPVWRPETRPAGAGASMPGRRSPAASHSRSATPRCSAGGTAPASGTDASRA